jgi:hypothetical protein
VEEAEPVELRAQQRHAAQLLVERVLPREVRDRVP